MSVSGRLHARGGVPRRRKDATRQGQRGAGLVAPVNWGRQKEAGKLTSPASPAHLEKKQPVSSILSYARGMMDVAHLRLYSRYTGGAISASDDASLVGAEALSILSCRSSSSSAPTTPPGAGAASLSRVLSGYVWVSSRASAGVAMMGGASVVRSCERRVEEVGVEGESAESIEIPEWL